MVFCPQVESLLLTTDEPRSGPGPEIETAAYHTLIRGLHTAGPFYVLAFLCLGSGIDSVCVGHDRQKVSAQGCLIFSVPGAVRGDFF
jgi:hypothetical protein